MCSGRTSTRLTVLEPANRWTPICQQHMIGKGFHIDDPSCLINGHSD
jgi:hypothetical protein